MQESDNLSEIIQAALLAGTLVTLWKMMCSRSSALLLPPHTHKRISESIDAFGAHSKDEKMVVSAFVRSLAAKGLRLSALETRKLEQRAPSGLSQGQYTYLMELLRTRHELQRRPTALWKGAALPPSALAQHAVFLGGSCNPTTWRMDSAMPFLDTHGITFYNPQVDDWSPELVAIEEDAKQRADVLLFVLDTQTRGIASMVECAHLAASGRRLVVAMSSVDADCVIDGLPVPAREVAMQNEARALLAQLLHAEGVPVFDDISAALEFTRSVFTAAAAVAASGPLSRVSSDPSSPASAAPRVLPLVRDMHLAHALAEVSAAYDAVLPAGAAALPMDHAQQALEALGTPSIGEDDVTRILAKHRNDAGIDRSAFFLLAAACLRDGAHSHSQGHGQHGGFMGSVLRMLSMCSTSSSCEDMEEHAAGDDDAVVAVPRDVYLGGATAALAPLLADARLSVFSPVRESAHARRAQLQAARHAVFVMDETTAGLKEMIEAAAAIAVPALRSKLVLCVRNVAGDTVVDGEVVTAKEAKDYNRGRAYLLDMAKRAGVPVVTEEGQVLALL